MSVNTTWNTDDVFMEIQRLRDQAQAHMSARADNALDHTWGVIAAAQAWILAEMMVRGLNDSAIDEKDRFRQARAEARKLMNQFWQYFKLFPISTPDGSTVLAQVVQDEPERGQYVMQPRTPAAKPVTPAPRPDHTNGATNGDVAPNVAAAQTNGKNGKSVIVTNSKGTTFARREHNLNDRERRAIWDHFNKSPRAENTPNERRKVAALFKCSPRTVANILYDHAGHFTK